MKKYFIIVSIIFNLLIVLCFSTIVYIKMRYFAQCLRYKYFYIDGMLMEDILFPLYIFVIPILSAFFAKKIKQIGLKKYWFINFALQCIVIVLCQLYDGFFDNRLYPEYTSFKEVLYDYFILPWDRFIVIFITFSMITVGIYYNQLLWDKILLDKQKRKNIICK